MLTAVSASDDIVPEDNVLESDISPADVSDELGGQYYDDDFYITVQEDYTWDKKDWNSRDVIYISSYSQKNGTFSFLVDDNEKLNVPLTNGYFSIEDDGMGGKYNKTFEYIYPANLSLDTGNYNIKVKFDGNTLIDNQVTLKEKDDFDFYIVNPYSCDDEDYFDYPSFIIIDSNHNRTGTLEIFVNGTRKTYFNVTDGAFDEIPDCSNKSRYLAPSDILDDYGTYDIKITFTDSSATETLRDEIVQVIGPKPSEPKLEMSFYFDVQYLRADNTAYIYLPREATGNLTIKYNNHVFDVPYSDGYAEHMIYAWYVQYLGETLVTAIYEGDDFGTLTANGTIIVTPGVTIPYYASLGEKFTISMITHEWVNGGKFDVYDYAGDVKGDLIASNVINKGLSSVTISSDTLGLNKFYLEYDTLGSGKYYSIQELNIIENSENVEVDVPEEVPVGYDFNMTVTAPPRDFSFVSISVDGKDSEFYSIDSGKLVKTIPGLSKGNHMIVVQYDYGYYEDGKWVEDVYSNTFYVNAYEYVRFDAPELIKDYNGSEEFTVTVYDLNNNTIPYFLIKIMTNNQTYNKATDGNGKAYLKADFDVGVYPVNITDDYNYATSKITINKVATKTDLSFEKFANNSVALIANVTPSSAGGQLVFNVNGEELKSEVCGHEVIWILTDLDAGNYTVTAVYNGDLNHINSTSNTIWFNIEKKYDVSAPDLTKYYKGPEKFVVTVKDGDNNPVSGKNVTITLNGVNYNRTTDSKGQASMAIGLNSGVYNVTSEFEGIKVNSTITVKSTISGKNVTKIYRNDTQYYATFVDTKGILLKNTDVEFNINGVFYTRTTNDQGVAKMNINLNPGTYIITATNPNSTEQYTNVITVLSSIVENHDLTKYYKNASQFTFRLLDSQGNPVGAGVSAKININGVFYTRTTNASGYVNMNINLNPGTYIATIEYNGLMMSNTVKVLPILKAENLSMRYKDGSKFEATLLDGQGNPHANQEITFNINGVFYDKPTDENGIARLNINLMPGEYIITSMYENGAAISNKITIRS